MNNYLILRSQNSPYNDITKNSVLSFADMDDNLLFLKGNIIYTAITNAGTVTLKKYNGEDITFAVGGSGSGDSYWTSGSTGNYSIKTINDSGLDATGGYSVAEGYNTLASGPASHAEGSGTKSIGLASHSEGYNTTTSGFSSHAEGYQTIAIGGNSHAEGYETIAGWKGFNSNVSNGVITISSMFGDVTSEFTNNTLILENNLYTYYDVTFSSGTNTEIFLDDTSINDGVYVADYQNLSSEYANEFLGDNSHAEGRYVRALGQSSHAEGIGSLASGNYSHVEGASSWALGIYSHAEGNASKASGETSHAEGRMTNALGNYSHSQGFQTTALGIASHAEGDSTNSNGQASHSEGRQTIADADYSHAEGWVTTASGVNGSHAEGFNTIASGASSHAEGSYTTAGGQSSHAGGYNSKATGDWSFIHSYNSLVTGVRSVVLGGQNITGITNDTVYVPYLNVQSATTDNALTQILVIDTSGNVKKRDVSTISGGGTFSGGTVTGPTQFIAGLTANTISATTYYGLPNDVYVTGGTYSSGTATFTNNTGGTFTVTGFSNGGGSSPISVVNTSSLFSTGLSNTGINASGVTNSLFLGVGAGFKASAASESYFIGLSAGTSATSATNSFFIGTNSGYQATGASSSNFIGVNAGYGAVDTKNSNLIGVNAGYGATNGNMSNFIGLNAGYGAVGALFTNLMGANAGFGVTNVSFSNFFGYNSGYGATNARYSNFIGSHAGSGATNASNSNFIGVNTGSGATNASYSNLIGFNVGKALISSDSIGSNNIIIGTNITLSAATTNSINIGGVLFGTGTYSAITGDQSISANTIGRIGIGVVTPTEKLHVSGNLLVDGNLTFTGQSRNPIYSAGTVTASHIPNWNNSNIQHVILSAATTNISGGTNIANGAVYTMILKQNASGSRVVNWGIQYKWQSGIAPVLTATANAVDILTFISDGTNLYGLIAKDFR